jgi:hypothetical protein
MTPSVRLPKKISIKGHTQMRPNLKPEFKAGGLTPEGSSRSSLWLVSIPYILACLIYRNGGFGWRRW